MSSLHWLIPVFLLAWTVTGLFALIGPHAVEDQS